MSRAERAGELLRPSRGAEHLGDEPLDDRQEVVAIQERSLDVDLRELRLAVRAEVLVPEAPHDLEVALEAADHQDLLEQLR